MAQTPLPIQPQKPGLGRGLEDLLGKRPPTETNGDLFDPPIADPQPVTLSPGFRTLLNANRESPPAPPATESETSSDNEPWVAGTLIGADLLFIVLAIWVVLASPPTWASWVLCILALAMGAWLSILAFLSQTK